MRSKNNEITQNFSLATRTHVQQSYRGENDRCLVHITARRIAGVFAVDGDARLYLVTRSVPAPVPSRRTARRILFYWGCQDSLLPMCPRPAGRDLVDAHGPRTSRTFSGSARAAVRTTSDETSDPPQNEGCVRTHRRQFNYGKTRGGCNRCCKKDCCHASLASIKLDD